MSTGHGDLELLFNGMGGKWTVGFLCIVVE